MDIRINFDKHSVKARLLPTPCGKAIYDALPFSAQVNTWGDEIYFALPVHVDLEDGARAEVEVGDLAYWPDMPAFCIFFGPTPVSRDNTPTAAGPVNVFGKLEDTDIALLRSISGGESVRVEAIN